MQKAIIAGIDEAGRGALAGPVVAAACHVAPQLLSVSSLGGRGYRVQVVGCREEKFSLVADSKTLSPTQREEAFVFLMQHCPYGVGIAEAAIVDEQGILAATELAMQSAVRELQRHIQPTYLLVDGRDKFWFDLPHSSIIRGDASEACIAAASIIAKVHRDRLMVAYEEQFPGYGFMQHKGYGTELHRAMLRNLDPCPLHRRTFLSSVTCRKTPSGALSR